MFQARFVGTVMGFMVEPGFPKAEVYQGIPVAIKNNSITLRNVQDKQALMG